MSDATARKPYGFQWGDRIDHPNFGMGTVIGEPIAVAGAETSPLDVLSRIAVGGCPWMG